MTTQRLVAGAIAAYLVWAVTFTVVTITGDGVIYYDFLQRLVGESPPHAYAYQFGVAYWNLPFYLVFRLADAVLPGDGFGGTDAGVLSISVASHAAVVLTLVVGWLLLRDVGLPPKLSTLALVVFGTPLFYYATFLPSYTHAADALFTALACLLLLKSLREPTRRVLIGLGVCLALLVAIRYLNAALLLGFALPFVLTRSVRDLAVVAASCAGSAVLLFGLPVVRGIEFASASTMRTVYGSVNDPPPAVAFDPIAPLKMLFTLHRGLFLWTPLTVLATAGFVLLAMARPELRRYLIGLGVAALGLVASYSLWSIYWDGGYSFSQRFFTGLFPLFLLGTAELVRRHRAAVVAAALTAVWSVFIGFNHFYGYEGASAKDGVDEIVKLYTAGERTPRGFAELVGGRAVDRWTRDPGP